MKKSRGKGERTGQRGVRDLAPRKTQDVKGGWSLPVVPAAAPKPKTTTEIDHAGFSFTHYLDKASPN